MGTPVRLMDQAVQAPSPPNRFHPVISAPAAVYTNFVEGGVGLVAASVEMSLNGLEMVFSPRKALRRLQDGAREWTGLPDAHRAVNALYRAPTIAVHGGRQVVDMRPFSERFGKCMGHLTNGAAKVVAAAAFLTAGAVFTVGKISNALSWESGDAFDAALGGNSEYQFGDLHQISRAFATGVTTLGSYLASFGKNATKLAARGAFAGITVIKNHPNATFNTLGISAALYLTASSIGRAERASTPVRRAAHIAAALFGLGVAAVVPFMSPLNRYSA